MFSFLKKKQRMPRKGTVIHGMILMDGHQYSFSSHDISVDGALINIDIDFLPESGIPVELRIDEFEINAHGDVRWAKINTTGGVQIGLKFSANKGLAGVNRLLDTQSS